MRVKGKIVSWNDDKGFGFIAPATGGKQLFVHIGAFGNRKRCPKVDQWVTYAVSTDRRGRPCAVDASLSGDRTGTSSKNKNGSMPIVFATTFLGFVVLSVIASKIPPLILWVYAVASGLSFLMYAVDKSAAQSGTWRTRESNLHLLSVAGGWPGALLAQQRLRHKSKKRSFQSLFWITVFVNCGVFIWLCTPPGADTLHVLLGFSRGSTAQAAFELFADAYRYLN